MAAEEEQLSTFESPHIGRDATAQSSAEFLAMGGSGWDTESKVYDKVLLTCLSFKGFESM